MNIVDSRRTRKFILGSLLLAWLCAATGLLEASAAMMYWTDPATDKIQRANLDGSGVEDVLTSLPAPQGIALDVAGGKMYWGDSIAAKIQRADLDGSEVEDLVTGVPVPFGIALDLAGGKMYWTDAGTDKIQRANLDGSEVEDLVADVNSLGIALDVAGGKMYWVDNVTDKIQRANLDGSELEDLITGPSDFDPAGIALDLAGGEMYVTNVGSAGDGTIRRANLSGSEVEILVTGLFGPIGIALDLAGGKMYWADNITDKIQRANLDGSGVEDLVTGLSDPVGIALDVAAPLLTVAIDIKPGSFPNSINLRSGGTVPVAILSTSIFDAATVDPVTVTLAGAQAKLTGKGRPIAALEDVDGDGLLDLVIHVETAALQLSETDTEAVLEGATFGGVAILGTDSVRVVP